MSIQSLRFFLLRVFVHSQLYVGVMAGIMTYLSMHQLGIIRFPVAIAVSFLTTGAYAYIRFMGKYNNINALYYKNMQWLLLPLAIVFTFTGGYVLYLQSPHPAVFIFLLLPPSLLVLLYPLKFTARPSFREIPGVKLSIIAFSWVWISVSVPAMLLNAQPDWDVLSTHLQRLFLMIAWILPFDIRDIDTDIKQMKTIPQVGGIQRSKQFISVVVFGTQFSFVLTGIIGFTSLPLSIAYILGLEFLNISSRYAQPGRDNGYYSFVVESLPLVILMCLLVGQII